MGRINRGVVTERKTLTQLLKEENPSSKTKGGEEYVFDKDVITMLGASLPKEVRERLKLPILFISDIRVEDSCYLNDEIALRALQLLKELGEMRTIREGKVWVGKSIAYSIMRKYPGVVQIVMG